jgi:hypothetical protein
VEKRKPIMFYKEIALIVKQAPINVSRVEYATSRYFVSKGSKLIGPRRNYLSTLNIRFVNE